MGLVARYGLHTEDQARTGRDVMARVAEDGIEQIRLAFPDQHGVLRGKAVAAAALPGALADGVGITATLLLKDTSHRTVVPVFAAGGGIGLRDVQGAADAVMVPDPLTFRLLPWLPRTGWMLCDLHWPDGRAIPFATRGLLRRLLGDLDARGFSFITGLEVEFHLTRLIDPRLAPADAGQPGTPPEVALLTQGYQYLTEARLNQMEPILEVLRREVMALGLDLRSIEVEYGPSQVEFTFAPGEGMDPADAMVLFRSAAKQVARRHGHHASFMCRPRLPNVMSSGWHLHQSLRGRDGGNVFAAADDAPLSTLGLHWLAGLLAHAPACAAFTTPTINGYKRYRANSLAPDRAVWGLDNRGVMLRVLGQGAAAHIENRVGEPAANPYLYAASQIVAGMAGLDAAALPPPPPTRPTKPQPRRCPPRSMPRWRRWTPACCSGAPSATASWICCCASSAPSWPATTPRSRSGSSGNTSTCSDEEAAMQRLMVAALAAWLVWPAPPPATAQVPLVRIGVLTDMSGPFADQVGPGSVVAAQLAAEDFAAEARGLRVEIVAADHQNRPDVGSAIARRWVDTENVAAIVDLPNSGVGLAVIEIMRERNRIALASSTASSDVTGRFCAPTTVQWVNDTWAQGNAVARALLRQGGDSWFFLTVDYALGHALERDATAALQAGGGRVLGVVRHPLNTGDFSSLLLRAQSSGANVIALAGTGTDAINAIKQAGEFGLLRAAAGGAQRRLAALFLMVSDVHALGLPTAQGLLLAEAFYWDLNDETRAWSRRWGQRMGGRMPTMDHAGVYSATLAYLRAVRDGGTLEGARVVEMMRRAPIQDPLFGEVVIRADDRAVHAMHIFRVKRPAESRGPWDLYERLDTIPPEQAFRPLADGGCRLVAR